MKKDSSYFEKKLQDERNVLVSELQSIGLHDKNRKDDWQAIPDIEIDPADSNEVSDRIESFEGNTALVNELESRLKEIDLATKNLKAGKFGMCEVCGKPIEDDRLEANPAARTCKAHINTRLAPPVL